MNSTLSSSSPARMAVSGVTPSSSSSAVPSIDLFNSFTRALYTYTHTHIITDPKSLHNTCSYTSPSLDVSLLKSYSDCYTTVKGGKQAHGPYCAYLSPTQSVSLPLSFKFLLYICRCTDSLYKILLFKQREYILCDCASPCTAFPILIFIFDFYDRLSD